MFDLQNQLEEREKVQKKAIKIFTENVHSLFSFSTGVGKSLTTIKCIESFNASSVLILIKESNHEQNWRDEFIKHGYTHLLERVEFYCYASLHKLTNNDYDIIVLDECHALSIYREDLLRGMRSVKMISLSATVPEDVKYRLNKLCPYYEYNIPISEAIEMGLLPEPIIYTVTTSLDDIEKKYIFKSKKGEKHFTGREYYKRIDSNVEYWKEKYLKEYEPYQEKKWLFGAINRKRWIAEYKMDLLKKVLKHIDNKRYICFVNSIKQAKEIGGKQAVHSKNKDNQVLIDNFNLLQEDRLVAVNMLRESMNLHQIEAGVILQIDNQEKNPSQQLGRILRSISPELYVLLLKDTIDIQYWNKVQQIFSPEYIKELIL